MLKKNAILLSGIFAILVLIAGQLIIIKGVWKQNDEMLYLRYRMLSQDAVNALRGSRFDPYDTVTFILNDYSGKIISKFREAQGNPVKTDELKKDALRFFTKVLDSEQDMSSYLSGYFEKSGFEKEFRHRIEISNLDIIGQDTFKIFRSESSMNRFTAGRTDIGNDPARSKSSILVYRSRIIRSNYALFFDYYINFSDKRRMILKEIALSLTMSIFSILVVVIIFLSAYRNLMEEKRLSNLKTDFINNMTHELKTPLATITVAGKTLEMEKIRADDFKILETAKLIGKQSVHLNQLINMILEISMWERTQFQLDRKKVDIGEVMDDIVSSFRTGCGNCAALNQKYNFKGVKADIDLVYFTTLVNNLLSNAVKYSDKDPVINIEGAADNGQIRINISDNGIGISKNDQKHIFDKFYRASSGNIHKYKGLGLGLYYVKRIAVAHGGDVTVSSKPGKGSIFTVTLPY